MKSIKITAEKAKSKPDQLLSGKKTINQVRQELGLNAVKDANFDKLFTKA